MEQEHSLAFQLLVELKASSKRWFVAFIVMLVIEIVTVGGFLWYLSLPVEEYKSTRMEQDASDIDGSSIIQRLGDDYGEGEANHN